MWLWWVVEVSCFSTTTADAINTAKPCRAACDVPLKLEPCFLSNCILLWHMQFVINIMHTWKFVLKLSILLHDKERSLFHCLLNIYFFQYTILPLHCFSFNILNLLSPHVGTVLLIVYCRRTYCCPAALFMILCCGILLCAHNILGMMLNCICTE